MIINNPRMNGVADDLFRSVGAAVDSVAKGGGAGDALKAGGEAFARTPTGQQAQSQITAYAADQLARKISANISKVAFYSAYSKPLEYTGQDISKQVGDAVRSFRLSAAPGALKPKTLIERVKPTLVIEGSFGRKVLAPYGEATPTEWKANIRNLVIGTIGIFAIYTAGAYYLGFKRGQRSRG